MEHKYLHILNTYFKKDMNKIRKLYPALSFKQIFEKLNTENKIYNVDKIYEFLKLSNIELILQQDPEYPKQLKEIHNPPLGIYVKGNKYLLNQQYIFLAIVGTRQCTPYGIKALEIILQDLQGYSIATISGLAYGIDTYVHKFSIKNNLPTIAVLGGGINKLYPKINQELSNQIIQKNGCIISEYDPNSRPEQHHFLERNRIISGLSRGIILIEASNRSGSLNTVNTGLDQNKDIFALPNSIFAQKGKGTNQLIKEGAKPILSGQDIINEYF
ncbi:MAG: DNA-processing protein DprA [Candidatus Pacebacteria bacterium]|nr:DNA-processing protein DprA [Candidatus Paceibacterota bacterium]